MVAASRFSRDYRYRGGKEFLERDPRLVAGWLLDQDDPLFVVPVHPFTAQGRNILTDGDMETATPAFWSVVNGAITSKQTTNPHGGARVLRVGYNGTPNPGASQTSLVIGRLYKMTGFMRSDGIGAPRANLGGVVQNGTTSTSWQAIDITAVATTAGVTLFNIISEASYAEFDDVQVFELNIPSSVPSLGDQLLVDGDMEAANAAAYTAFAGATLTKETGTPYEGSRVLRIARNGQASPGAQQAILTVGKRYRVTGYVRSDGSAVPSIITTAGTGLFTGVATHTGWQYFEFSFLADATTIRFRHNSNTGTQWVEYDAIRVVEDLTIFPGTRIQDGDMEASGVTWWTAQNSAVLTKETGTPFQGSQVLRVTRNGVNNASAFQNILITGKRYRARGYYRSDGVGVPTVLDLAINIVTDGSLPTAWTFFDVVWVAGGASFFLRNAAASNSYVEFDSVTVEEVSPMTASYGGSGTTVGRPASPFVRKQSTLNGSGYLNLYSASLNSVMPFDEATFVWIGNLDTWTGTTVEYMFHIGRTTTANLVFLDKTSTSRNLIARHNDGVNAPSPQAMIAPLKGLNLVSVSYSVAQSYIRVYINGVFISESTTGMAVQTPQAPALGSTTCVLGAQNTTPSNPNVGSVGGLVMLNAPADDRWHRELAWRLGLVA